MRTHQLHIRLSDAERARLEALAAHFGLSGSGTVRMLLKREADQVKVVERARAT